MFDARMILAATALSLSACAGQGTSLKAMQASTSVVGIPEPAAKTGNVETDKVNAMHRQYFDKRKRRYYYFNPELKQYFWENGERKI